MAKGKFSQPRPNREEEREIEQAFRQVTGQEAAPQPPKQPQPEADPAALDLILDEAGLEENLSQPELESEEPVEFADKVMALFNKAAAFFEQNRKIALLALCGAALVLILLFISIFFLSSSDPYDKTILDNVVIGSVNVGGMTKNEAISAVKDSTSLTYSSLDMVVDLAGTEVRLSPSDTKPSLDVKAAVNEAYDYGRTGTKAEREQAYLDSLTETHIIGLLPYLELEEDYILDVLNECAANSGSTLTQVTYGLEGSLPDLEDEDFDPKTAEAQTLVIILGTPGVNFDVDSVYEQILDAYSLQSFTVTVEGLDTVSEPDPVDLQAIYDEFYIEPVNATVDLKNYEVIPGTYGYGFDLEEAQKLVDKADYGEEIRIPMEFIAPTVLNEEMFYQDILAEYDTSYKDTGNLQTNLALACEAINGTIVNPGETFSFNDTVGQRTSAKGYKYADDQIGTEKNRILGGGISQVSSALYYCVLVADMEVTNRTSHSLVPGYSDYGLDAAVGWSTPDFKFKNTLGFPIRIDAEAVNGKVSVSIVGTDERDYYVAMDYEISGTKAFQTEYKDFDADNEEGYKDGEVIQQGAVGYTIKTYRLKYDDHTGELVSRDFVTTTQYLSTPKIIARVAEEETTEETEEPTEKPTEEPTQKPTESTEATTAPETTEAPDEPTVPTTQATTPPPEETTPATDPTSASVTDLPTTTEGRTQGAE